MRAACVYTPHVKTNSGIEESKLFNDLLSFTHNNREETKQVYSHLKSNYITNRYGDRLRWNDQGEPDLQSAISLGIIDDAKTTINITKDLGEFKKGETAVYSDTKENYSKLADKTIEFNRNSQYKDNFVAVVRKNNDGNIYLSVERINDENSLLAKKIQKNKVLNDKIRNILISMGVSVGTLNNIETAMGERGVVDYERAETLANGMLQLIRIAEGSTGEQVLPEEFVHLVIDLMRDEDPMVQRLLSSALVIAPKILGDEYQAYVERYGEDTDRMVREVAGHLVSRALMGEFDRGEYKNFFQRIVANIKAFINRMFNKEDINQAVYDAEQIALGIANRILTEDKFQKVEQEKLKGLSNLFNLQNKAINVEKILQRNVDLTLKKLAFYTEAFERRIKQAPEVSNDPKVKTKDELKRELDDYKAKLGDYIGQQNINIASGQFNIGVTDFINRASQELNGVKARLNACINDNLSLKEKAYNLRNIKNILESLEETINDLTLAIQYEDPSLSIDDNVKGMFNTLVSNMKQAKSLLNDQGLLTFANYLEKFFDKTVEYGQSGKRKTVSKDDLIDMLKTAESDIHLLDTWVMSAAESQDFVLKLTDQALKASKERKRRRVLDISKRLEQAAKRLPSTNTDFMFERHADGSIAGRYKSDKNWTAYRDAERKMLDELDEKYGKITSGNNAVAKRQERSAWYAANMIASTGEPNYKYDTDPYEGMTDEQKAYYDTFMSIRSELLDYLPAEILAADPMRAVQINKDMWERLKSNSPTRWLQEYFKEAKNSIITTVDDTQFGKNKPITDFKDRKLMSVPIFFINHVADRDLSTDTVSTLEAFADMAINYDEMMEIADYLEIGRDVMENREAGVVRGNTQLKEELRVMGQKVISPLKQDSNNFVTRYNELLKSQLYGRYMNDGVLISGEGWEIKSNKVATWLNKISSLNQLALNGLAGIAAVVNDVINVNSESLAGQFFKGKHLRQADATYLKELPKVLAEMGNPVKTSKLGLFIEMFDVLHEYDNDIRDKEWDKNKIKKLMSSNSLYIFMHMGSHWGETRTALAQAMATQITSDDGTETSTLWDILEVEPLNPAHPEEGARLKVKDGYSLSEKDITYYTRKFMGLNERLFGVYNQADRNALQATAVGQLIFLYRKFMVPAISRRFGKADYNLDLDEETEGYYRTAGRFLYQLARDSKGLSRDIKMYWNQMTDNEKANCIRAAHELGVFALLSGVVALLTAADWDKKENPWYKRFLAYMARRARTEVGAFTPIGIFGETWNIIKSPAAAINTLENASDILGVLNPWHYEELLGGEEAIIKNGRYKGHNKAYRDFMNSPFVPMNRTLYKMLHPEESIVAFR